MDDFIVNSRQPKGMQIEAIDLFAQFLAYFPGIIANQPFQEPVCFFLPLKHTIIYKANFSQLMQSYA
jgi:hypothetical protein